MLLSNALFTVDSLPFLSNEKLKTQLWFVLPPSNNKTFQQISLLIVADYFVLKNEAIALILRWQVLEKCISKCCIYLLSRKTILNKLSTSSPGPILQNFYQSWCINWLYKLEYLSSTSLSDLVCLRERSKWSTFPFRICSRPSGKHWTKLEWRERNKHSSMLRPLINYGWKSFISFALGYKLNFYRFKLATDF